MLQQAGLSGQLTSGTLLGVHRALQAELGVTQRSSVLDLLHAAAKVHQQMERGTDFRSAMMAACREVYVQGHCDAVLRKVSRICVYTLIAFSNVV